MIVWNFFLLVYMIIAILKYDLNNKDEIWSNSAVKRCLKKNKKNQNKSHKVEEHVWKEKLLVKQIQKTDSNVRQDGKRFWDIDYFSCILTKSQLELKFKPYAF